MKEYDHKAIEKKWQDEWEKSGIYRADKGEGKPKQYILDMFPYPSGSGLHVGHVEGYTATDIYSRFQRMRGLGVLHPMGWDSFGLPAENFAIKTGTPPQESTNKAIETFRKQIKALGLSYDWTREVGAHNPDYYKWTQWFFLFLYKSGLAEKRMARVNWCPTDQTVLANEQTVSEEGVKGVCFRCGTPVVQKELAQWFFKITDFADDLVTGLDQVDWPESTKINQRNWIGRSEGAEIDFDIVFAHGQQPGRIPIFTTRPDTLFGATYMVLAPEHTWVTLALDDNHTGVIDNADEVRAYVNAAKQKADIDRTAEGKEKTGVQIKGVMAVNPATKEEVPLFVADYVLATYGTGAVMAVPAHDERDFEFAKKYSLPMKQVVTPPAPPSGLESPPCYTGVGYLTESGKFNGEFSEDAKKKIIDFVGGRVITKYKLRDWLVSRQRYWGAPIPVVYDPEGNPHPIPEEHLPWLLPTDVEYLPKGMAPLGTSKELQERTEKIFGKDWKPEIDTLDTFVCSSWYFFRFADPKDTSAFASPEALKKWLPVDLYMGGAEHTVLHLMYARFFTKALQKFGYLSFNEPFMKLRHQGTILAEDGSKMSKSKGNVINPDDIVTLYGADTLRMYEMFMGPLEAMKPWNTKSIIGPRRFIERVWRLSERVGKGELGQDEPVLHRTIKKVGDDIATFGLNTAISQMMICLNTFESLVALPREAYETYLKLLAPFAPHVTEELWQSLGNKGSIHLEPWPTYDATKLVSDSVVIAVQVAGKTRGVVTVPQGAGQGEVLEIVKKDSKLAIFLTTPPSRIVYVPDRVINLIP